MVVLCLLVDSNTRCAITASEAAVKLWLPMNMCGVEDTLLSSMQDEMIVKHCRPLSQQILHYYVGWLPLI